MCSDLFLETLDLHVWSIIIKRLTDFYCFVLLSWHWHPFFWWPTFGCDLQIIVLENGKVVEHGPHEVLLSRAGRYAQLWAQQNNNDVSDVAAKVEAWSSRALALYSEHRREVFIESCYLQSTKTYQNIQSPIRPPLCHYIMQVWFALQLSMGS